METLKVYPEASMHHFHFPCFFCGREVSIGGIDFRVKRGKKSYPVCRECANPTKDIRHRIRTNIDNLKNKIEYLEEVFKAKIEYPTIVELTHEKEKLKRWKSEIEKSTKVIDPHIFG